jgi:hypothetical protein
MTSDGAILETVRKAFSNCPKPEHFTDHRHCCECREHDDVLRSRDLETLTLSDVGNAGWDPLCFVSPEGFAYFLPALARLALAEPDAHLGWYVPQLLFHLGYGGNSNRFVQCFTPEQKQAIVGLLWHIYESRSNQVTDHTFCETDLQYVIDLWSK